MGLCIVLENEAGESLEMLLDGKNLLHKLLPSHDDDAHPLLASIDWYGDTVFNNLQMKRFLAEWENLVQRAGSPEEQELVAGIKSLGHRCRDGVHLYLKFIGD